MKGLAATINQIILHHLLAWSQMYVTLLNEDRVPFQSTKYLSLTHFSVIPDVSTSKATKNTLLENDAFVTLQSTCTPSPRQVAPFCKALSCRALEALWCSVQHCSLQNQLWLNRSLLLAPGLRICPLETQRTQCLQEWPSYAAPARNTLEFYNTVIMASLHISFGHHEFLSFAAQVIPWTLSWGTQYHPNSRWKKFIIHKRGRQGSDYKCILAVWEPDGRNCKLASNLL